jgi:NAD(P)H-hydrate repair Nnr-like enzyme with NAD(P)H-hydrate dehydratase domain
LRAVTEKLAVLAAKAAIKTGCGLVTAFVPECGYEILQIAIPEVMVITDVTKRYLSDIKFQIKPQAIGIGPGIGQEQVTQKSIGFPN